MSTHLRQSFGSLVGSSRWLANQAASSADMVRLMVTEELRRGDFTQLDARVARIEEMVGEHALDAQHERELLLLAAMFLEGGGESRRAYRIAGRLLADKERLEHTFLSLLRRFRARLALNHGDISTARAEVTLTERMVMETLRGLGEVTEIIDHDDISKVTAATWLLSAEISLAEQEFDNALQDLANAWRCMSVGTKSSDESATFELLSALVCVGMGDSGGAPALAYLYHLHVDLRSESPIEALTSARIAAAAGDMGHVVGISEAEAARWRSYGPDPDVVQHYLREGSAAPGPGGLLEKLPAPHELIAALEAGLVEAPRETTIVEDDVETKKSELLPMAFLFKFFRLEEVTSMFDYNLKTGHLAVDWSECEKALVLDAVAVGAISDLALRCSGGTIYLNNGAYVDACLDSAEDDLQQMTPENVIFELFRISTAGLHGSGARQLHAGGEEARVPEVINLRPNRFNLDLMKRLDHMRSGREDLDGVSDDQELNLDTAFAGWDTGTKSEALLSELQVKTEERSSRELVVTAEEAAETGIGHGIELSPLVVSGLSSLAGVLDALDVIQLELGIIECLASLGLGEARLEITVRETGEKFRECGLNANLCKLWKDYVAGPFKISLSFGSSVQVSGGDLVDVLMKASVQRLRLFPGRQLAGSVDAGNFVAEDPETLAMLSNLRDLAQLDGAGAKQKLKHILLVGERGTGKELLARAIHSWSGRANGIFRVVNLGAINKELAPSEIFGSKKGSYTGSSADRSGFVEDAEGGTLFLDELDEASDSTQALLKRIVQFGTYSRVGAPDEVRANVRFVAATNRVRGADELIKADLRDRFLEIRIPPLRDRKGDIRPLAARFAAESQYVLPEPVFAYLASLEWPGNVRQLETVVERVCLLAKSKEDITLAAFEASVKESGANCESMDIIDASFAPLRSGETLDDRLRQTKRHYILEALTVCKNNKTHAADYLGMSRQTFREMMKVQKIGEVVLSA